MREIKLGETLKAKIKGLGVSQEKFAEMINREKGTINGWCRGKITPKLPDIVFLAEYFNMTLEELVFGEDQNNE